MQWKIPPINLLNDEEFSESGLDLTTYIEYQTSSALLAATILNRIIQETNNDKIRKYG